MKNPFKNKKEEKKFIEIMGGMEEINRKYKPQLHLCNIENK